MAKSRRTKISSRKMRKSLRHHKRAKKTSRKYHSRKANKTHKRVHRRRISRRRHRMMHGGTGCMPTVSSPSGNFSFIPSTFTDMGRSVQYGTMSAYAAANGDEGPVNPLPYKDQLNNGELPDDVMLLA